MIPKSDIQSASWENGVLKVNLSQPYSSLAGNNSSEMSFSMPDTASAGSFVNWMGVPVTGYTGQTGEADRATTQYRNPQTNEISFDVQNGDQRGRLVVGPNALNFVSLTDADHSRSWQYSQIKEFKRDNDDKQIKVEPYHGDDYEFQFHNKAMFETAYDMISNHIVTARLHK